MDLLVLQVVVDAMAQLASHDTPTLWDGFRATSKQNSYVKARKFL
jgi:hypothetical protein